MVSPNRRVCPEEAGQKAGSPAGLPAPQVLRLGKDRANQDTRRLKPPCCHEWRPHIMERYMKARVYVSFKSTVLDPQGQTICGALNGLGHTLIQGVRQG